MAVAPDSNPVLCSKQESHHAENGYLDDKLNDLDDHETSDSEDDADSAELHELSSSKSISIALACDDGCLRIYSISDSDELAYNKSLPRVSGESSPPLFCFFGSSGFDWCL